MAEAKPNDAVKPFDPVVPVEGEPQENETAKSGSGLAVETKGNTKIVIAGVSIFFSVIIYFVLFSGGGGTDVVDNRAIPEDAKRKTTVDSSNRAIADNNIGSLFESNFDDKKFIDDSFSSGKELLDLPSLPALPDNVRDSIKEEIKEIKKEKVNEEVFTKKEVDNLINDKLKMFENEMKRVKNESEKLAKEIERQKILEEEENKKKKTTIIPNFINKPQDPFDQNAPPGLSSSNTPPGAGSSSNSNNPADMFAIEEKKRQEEEKKALMAAQRNKVMEERRGSSMFKVQGGGGGDNTSTTDQNSIIITNKDSLQTVQDSQVQVQTTKAPDLSRMLLQGKIINVILETALNTDVQSQIRAIVNRDVYSEIGKNILIPKGSKLIGSFSANGIKGGVSRINIVWSRIIRVDGLNINITADTSDNLGRGGVNGELDSKYMQIAQNALLSSLMTIGSSLILEKVTGSVGITNVTGTETDGKSSTTQTTGKASDFAIVDATKNFTDQMQKIIDSLAVESPTIRVAQGTKINVVVNQDISLPIFKQNK